MNQMNHYETNVPTVSVVSIIIVGLFLCAASALLFTVKRGNNKKRHLRGSL